MVNIYVVAQISIMIASGRYDTWCPNILTLHQNHFRSLFPDVRESWQIALRHLWPSRIPWRHRWGAQSYRTPGPVKAQIGCLTILSKGSIDCPPVSMKTPSEFIQVLGKADQLLLGILFKALQTGLSGNKSSVTYKLVVSNVKNIHSKNKRKAFLIGLRLIHKNKIKSLILSLHTMLRIFQTAYKLISLCSIYLVQQCL